MANPILPRASGKTHRMLVDAIDYTIANPTHRVLVLGIDDEHCHDLAERMNALLTERGIGRRVVCTVHEPSVIEDCALRLNVTVMIANQRLLEQTYQKGIAAGDGQIFADHSVFEHFYHGVIAEWEKYRGPAAQTAEQIADKLTEVVKPCCFCRKGIDEISRMIVDDTGAARICDECLSVAVGCVLQDGPEPAATRIVLEVLKWLTDHFGKGLLAQVYAQLSK